MARTKITVDMPTEEEFEKLFENVSDEDFEEHLEALGSVATLDELLELLEEIGLTITEEELDDNAPGPNDTIH